MTPLENLVEEIPWDLNQMAVIFRSEGNLPFCSKIQFHVAVFQFPILFKSIDLFGWKNQEQESHKDHPHLLLFLESIWVKDHQKSSWGKRSVSLPRN